MYKMTNGVKQGAVLSPKLFTIYIDGLVYELRRACVACHINGEFEYADDVIVLIIIISLHALNYITVCEDYAKRFSILFNPI